MEIHFNNSEVKTMDFRADLARVTCPTLVMSGEMDPVCPPSSFHEIVDIAPRGIAEPHLIAGAGHMVMLDAQRGVRADPARLHPEARTRLS